MDNRYYVYCGMVNRELVYIGKGTGSRTNHLNSGTSSCYKANKAHFNGHTIEVMFMVTDMIESKALEVEARLIMKFKPAWNTQIVNTGIHVSWSKELLENSIRDYLLFLPKGMYASVRDMAKFMGVHNSAIYVYAKKFDIDLTCLKYCRADKAPRAATQASKLSNASNKRLQVAINVFTDKKNKVAKMPALLKSHGVSQRTLANYKKEFAAELKALGLIK